MCVTWHLKKSMDIDCKLKNPQRQAEELGMTLEWLPDGSLKTTSPTLPATKLDERTGKISWFNSIVAYVFWGLSHNIFFSGLFPLCCIMKH